MISQGYEIDTPITFLTSPNSIVSCDGTDYDDDVDDDDIDVQNDVSHLSSCEDAVDLVYPLHVAEAGIKGYSGNDYKEKQAMRVINILVKNGADCMLGCGDVLILNAEGYKRILFKDSWPRNTVLHIAMHLKKYDTTNSDKCMDAVRIKLLQDLNISKTKDDLQDKSTDYLLLMDLAFEYDIKPLILISVATLKKRLKLKTSKRYY